MNTLAEILVRPDVWRGDRCAVAPLPTVATGFADLDAELPGGGWPRGALTELLVDGCGFGELSLLMPALRRLRENGGGSLLVAPPHPLHAPAWAAAGVDLARLVVVSPASQETRRAAPSVSWPLEGRTPRSGVFGVGPERDALWAMEQALASGAPRAVVGWLPHADARALRRLQVAAAGSEAPAFLFRPARLAAEASAAPLRLQLAGEGGQLAVRILKRRGPPLAATIRLALPRPAPLRRHESALAGHPAHRQFAPA